MENNKHLLTMSILASPNMANFSGVVHGGEILKLLDQVAYACATRYCGVGVVTLAVDQVLFRHPIPIGSLMHFYASINFTGNTSCEVGIRTEYEDLKTQKRIHCNSAYFTMIALNEKKQKVQIPPFVPQNEEQKRRFQEAKERREKRFG
ncbi:acyl-CoA thioesterase [Helicobacter sp. faydin-H17]|uniref:acyl-CoA thioesterase n=2 Tax=Helicobacter kayseriensis TaxID=2905877 RepID=UPI001E59755D|nr:acyl-CoA thioesterase [Helicobacter kayseriensis]MCE3046523.1 acyl-CoA thioesterase [Helicobacter kayseriensis]MCE3048174.1 acyl-CoA thioesterase [Helicobacter kayseriensis]